MEKLWRYVERQESGRKEKRKPKEENIKKEIAHILEYKEYLKTFTIMWAFFAI